MNLNLLFNWHILWALPLTLFAYFLSVKIAAKLKHPLCNTMLVSVLFIAIFLIIFSIPYQNYFAGNQIIHQCLQLGIVSLAFPLYRQTPNICKRWKIIPFACFFGSLFAMISGVAIACWCGANPAIAASVLPKSVTTPIALALSKQLGGVEAIAVAGVVIAGIFGAVCGHGIFRLCRITHPSARGLAMGATSHAIGTGKCAEISQEEAAYSSIALVLCGFFTAITAPFVFHVMMKIIA